MKSSRGPIVQDWLYRYLVAYSMAEPLPKLKTIAAAAPADVMVLDAYLVSGALDQLAEQGKIRYRHGTRSEHRGHQAIRIVVSGAVLKTAGCPFDPPER